MSAATGGATVTGMARVPARAAAMTVGMTCMTTNTAALTRIPAAKPRMRMPGRARRAGVSTMLHAIARRLPITRRQ